MQAMIILVSCPDQPGIVAKFTDVLYRLSANIISLEQHIEDSQQFFMRIHADVSAAKESKVLQAELESVARDLQASLNIHDPGARQRVAILASTQPACLEELLNKHQSGELDCEIVLVASDHDTLRPLAERAGIPFHHLPIEPGKVAEQEAKLLQLLSASDVDLVILARYMKVLSEEFISAFADRVINIHHGFLPAFKGSRPYHQAWEAGVKIIGATSHFATAELDAGPIIAQDVMPVTHHYSADRMVKAGRDIERRVLAQAVEAFLEHRIIVHNRRTIIFH